MVRHVSCIAVMLFAGSSLLAGELDGDFKAKSAAAPVKVTGPAFIGPASLAPVADAGADVWKAGELDGEKPAQAWGGWGWRRGCGWGGGWRHVGWGGGWRGGWGGGWGWGGGIRHVGWGGGWNCGWGGGWSGWRGGWGGWNGGWAGWGNSCFTPSFSFRVVSSPRWCW
jgi:hypothetical protein